MSGDNESDSVLEVTILRAPKSSLNDILVCLCSCLNLLTLHLFYACLSSDIFMPLLPTNYTLVFSFYYHGTYTFLTLSNLLLDFPSIEKYTHNNSISLFPT